MSEISAVYIDTSAFLAVAFSQKEGKRVYEKISLFKTIVSSDLLVSEAYAAFVREECDVSILPGLLDMLTLLSPGLSFENVARVFQHGYLRGVDAHHLACALWLCDNKPQQVRFITLDERQAMLAKKLGFVVR